MPPSSTWLPRPLKPSGRRSDRSLPIEFHLTREMCRRHLSAEPAGLDAVRRAATGKFNDTFEVALPAGPVILRIGRPTTRTMRVNLRVQPAPPV